MSIISDHKPHVPWRHVRAVITPKGGDEHHVDLHVADEPSIHEWLASSDRPVSAAELAPVSPTDLPGTPLFLEAEHVTVHRELDDDEQLAEQLLAMERDTHALADMLAAENDTRMTLLLGRLHQLDETVGAMVSACNRAWEATTEALKRLVVTRRRKARITPLVLGLGVLVAAGDVSMETAAAVVSLRSRYLSATETDSRLLPKLTPEVLAELDERFGYSRTLGLRIPQAPGSAAAA